MSNSHVSSLIGVDISSSSVKILEISKVGDQYCVENYAKDKLQESVFDGIAIKDIDALAKSIKSLLTKANIKSKKVACAVPEVLAISKVIQINNQLTNKEIEEYIFSEADKYIPYPIDEINIDFNILGKSTKNSNTQDVLLVATRKENINCRIDLMARAGLVLKIVDVEPYAIERAAQLLIPDLIGYGENKIIAIIDIGNNYTNTFILNNMKNIYSRQEEFGLKNLIDAIVQKYKMKPEEAIFALEQGGLPEDYTVEILRPFKEQVLMHVKRSLQFFFSTFNHQVVDQIVLAGNSAKIRDLSLDLHEFINIPTLIANPFAHMRINNKINRFVLTNDAPTLMIACGLALKACK